jgi:NADH:ubiquinone oxidoreductase subunit 4 (subunit M)
VIQELIEEKTPKALASLPHSGADWDIHYAFFAHRGFTDAAQALAKEHNAQLVDLTMLDHGLTKAMLFPFTG